MRIELVILAALVVYSTAYNATLYTVQEAIEDHYIVVLQPGYDANEITQEISTDASGIFSGCSIEWTYTKALSGFSAKLTPKALEKIRAMKAVKYVAQDGIVRSETVGSWGLDRVNQRNLPLDGKADFTGDGSGVNVYVIDTGIYPESLYFNGRAEVVFDAIPAGDGIDCNGHGTHCAGTVGADLYGIARGVKLLGVRVFDCTGSGQWSYLTAALDYIVKSGTKPAVASMSLSGGAYEVLDDAVRGMIAAGIPAVAAAGNQGTDACERSPARVPEVITVAATDINDKIASFSNYGSCVDIFAPGVNIPSAWIGGREEIKVASGTSMACPHVTAAVAIALSKSPCLDPAELKKKILFDSTKDVVKNPGPGSPNRLLYIP